ncbi:CPBP family intramembrane glutamic endopeptidase [Lactiplantibacillus carotarum]|uniref:CPBP family intramembrane glutamic endopeptidase n=1 Tax=Lactiplantibacillus carotarum TaxID=2993456 RepID=UPI00298F2356|nr:CPBP family intramembrane glutamic endopeptidase [Lactiplantibacillus carotarum]
MRPLRLATSLWLTMVGALILISLLFKLPALAALSSLLATGFEELILIMLLLFLNDRYVHQPLSWHTDLTWSQQLKLTAPVLLVAIYVTVIGVTAIKSGTTLGLTLLVAVLVSAFEECLFRGILFKLLTADFHNVTRAALLSSLLFSLTHLVNLTHQDWTLTGLQLIFTFAIGLLLCGLYQRTGSLWWPLGIHAANDFFSFSQPTINLPLIHTTASFQILETLVILVLGYWVWRVRLTPQTR